MKPAIRATFYLFISLFGMLAGGLFPVPFSSLLHLTSVLAAVWIEKSCFGTLYVPKIALDAVKKPYLWLLFPIFGALTLGANLLSSRITVALGGTLPDVVPTLPLFLGAVLIAPIAEELLFRGLLLRLLSGFGEGWAILLSALLFALAHGDLFQAPYALVAGVLLGYTATLGGGLFYPFAFHFLYNLLAFFGEGTPPYVLLGVLGVLALIAVIPLMRGKRLSPLKKGEKPTRADLLSLSLYGAVMLYFCLL